MKYLDRIGLIGVVNTVLITTIPYFTLFFKWDENVRTRTEQIVILSTIVLTSLFTLFFSRRYLKNVARVEGFAWGYFYNFIYELADLINDKEANITIANTKVKTAEKDKEQLNTYSSEYTIDEIKILIIIPNDIHAEYRLSEIVSGIFENAIISPGKNSFFAVRDKHMKGVEIKKNGKRLLLLIDTPPTTMRAIKLYQESCHNIDHNDAFKDLDKEAKKNFNHICALGRKNIAPIFKKSLTEIIINLTRGQRNHNYKELIEIMTLDEFISNIIDKGQFENLAFIGDNNSKESKNERDRVQKLVTDRKSMLLRRLTDVMANKHF